MRKNWIRLLVISLAIFLSLTFTSAYFSSSSKIKSTYNTKDYTFKINGTGGTFSSSKVVVSDGATTLPTPNRNGYTFLGYSKTLNGNVDYNNKISNVDKINNNTIYAKWQTITYTIGYNLNGSTVSGTNKTSYTVETDTFSLINPNKTGHTFSGWTGSNGSSPQTSVSIPKGSTGNRNYNANWQVNSYTVDVNPVIAGTTQNAGKTGFTFSVYVDGVLKASNVIDWCQSVPYGSTVRVVANSKSGYTLSNNDVTQTVGTSGLTFSPTWSLINYSISYNLNSGSISGQKTSYNVETATFSLINPNKTGHTFTGWTGSNGSSPQTSVSIPKGSTGNRSYTANWVKYNANDYGGIYLVSTRDGANWSGTLTAFYNVGDHNVNNGNWLVTVDSYCAYITGTKYPTVNYTYQFYVYKANSTSELLKTGSATAGNGNNARATICW